MGVRHLAFGLLCAWIVGIGRWWEDPRAGLLQHLGLGSVIYVFALALFLWLILWPLNPPHWRFVNLLTFISITSLPGIVYAIPVRHGLSLSNGQTIRLWLLALVAAWRVLLLAFYLGRAAGLAGFLRFLGTIFPLTLIVAALTVMNLEKVVFNIMGGIHESQRSVNDEAYGILFLLTALSFYAFIPLFLGYLISSVIGLRARFKQPRLELPAGKN